MAHTVVSAIGPSSRRYSMRIKQLFPHLKSLRIEHITIGPQGVTLSIAVQRRSARCPLCGSRSRRVHSRYHRTLADLPISGRRVILAVRVRRFRCLAPACPRQIFAERFPDLAAPFARRSQPLQHALARVGFAFSGEAGARLARCLGMPTSPDTLLRLIPASHASSDWTTGPTNGAFAMAALSATWSGIE